MYIRYALFFFILTIWLSLLTGFSNAMLQHHLFSYIQEEKEEEEKYDDEDLFPEDFDEEQYFEIFPENIV